MRESPSSIGELSQDYSSSRHGHGERKGVKNGSQRKREGGGEHNVGPAKRKEIHRQRELLEQKKEAKERAAREQAEKLAEETAKQDETLNLNKNHSEEGENGTAPVLAVCNAQNRELDGKKTPLETDKVAAPSASSPASNGLEQSNNLDASQMLDFLSQEKGNTSEVDREADSLLREEATIPTNASLPPANISERGPAIEVRPVQEESNMKEGQVVTDESPATPPNDNAKKDVETTITKKMKPTSPESVTDTLELYRATCRKNPEKSDTPSQNEGSCHNDKATKRSSSLVVAIYGETLPGRVPIEPLRKDDRFGLKSPRLKSRPTTSASGVRTKTSTCPTPVRPHTSAGRVGSPAQAQGRQIKVSTKPQVEQTKPPTDSQPPMKTKGRKPKAQSVDPREEVPETTEPTSHGEELAQPKTEKEQLDQVLASTRMRVLNNARLPTRSLHKSPIVDVNSPYSIPPAGTSMPQYGEPVPLILKKKKRIPKKKKPQVEEPRRPEFSNLTKEARRYSLMLSNIVGQSRLNQGHNSSKVDEIDIPMSPKLVENVASLLEQMEHVMKRLKAEELQRSIDDENALKQVNNMMSDVVEQVEKALPKEENTEITDPQAAPIKSIAQAKLWLDQANVIRTMIEKEAPNETNNYIVKPHVISTVTVQAVGVTCGISRTFARACHEGMETANKVIKDLLELLSTRGNFI